MKKELTDHKCDNCGKLFTIKAHLDTHIRTIHEGEKRFTCDSCGRAFTDSGNLKRHIIAIHEGKKCKTCNEQFSTAQFLINHISAVHKSKNVSIDRSIKCDFCSTHFFSAPALKMHVCKSQVSNITNVKNELQNNAHEYNSLQFIAMQYQDID